MIEDFIKFVRVIHLFNFKNKLMTNEKYYSHNTVEQIRLSITGKRKGLYSDVNLNQIYDKLDVDGFLKNSKINLELTFKISVEELSKLNSSLDYLKIKENKIYFKTFSELALYFRSFNKEVNSQKIKLSKEKDLLAVVTNDYKRIFETLSKIHDFKEFEKITKALRSIKLETFDYTSVYKFFKEEGKALKRKKVRKILYNLVSTAVEEEIDSLEKLFIHDKLINENLIDSAKKELSEDELWRLKSISNFLNNNSNLLFSIFSKLIESKIKASVTYTSKGTIKGFDLLLNTVESTFNLVKDNKKLLFYAAFSIIEFINKNLKFLKANEIYLTKGSLLDFLDVLLDYVTNHSLSNDFKILNYIQELSLLKENLYKKAYLLLAATFKDKYVNDLQKKNNDFLKVNKCLKETASFELLVFNYSIIGYNVYKRYTLNSTPRYYNTNDSSFTSFYTQSGINNVSKVVTAPNVLSVNQTKDYHNSNRLDVNLRLFFEIFESKDIKDTIDTFADVELKNDFNNLVVKAKKYKKKWEDNKIIVPGYVEMNIKNIRAFKNLITFVKKDFAEFLMKHTNVIIDCNHLSSFENYSLAISKFFIKYLVPFNFKYNKKGKIEVQSFIFDVADNKNIGAFRFYTFDYKPIEHLIKTLENPVIYNKPSLENIVEEQKPDLFVDTSSVLSFLHNFILKF